VAKTIHILVVDDDPVIAAMLVEVFEAFGLEASFARTGAEALRLLEERPCDVVVSDLQMPEMTGCELWERLGRWRPDLAASMVFISAAPPEAAVRGFLRHSGHPCLTKPFALPELLALVRRAVARTCGGPTQAPDGGAGPQGPSPALRGLSFCEEGAG
jgi:CheY-like chemotaxis protein